GPRAPAGPRGARSGAAASRRARGGPPPEAGGGHPHDHADSPRRGIRPADRSPGGGPRPPPHARSPPPRCGGPARGRAAGGGGGGAENILHRFDLVIDASRMKVTRAGRPIDLTPTEFQILAALARRPGRVLSRAQLLEAVRGGEVESFDRAIDAHIKNIRRKL